MIYKIVILLTINKLNYIRILFHNHKPRFSETFYNYQE